MPLVAHPRSRRSLALAASLLSIATGCVQGGQRRGEAPEPPPSIPRERITPATAARVTLVHTLEGHADWARCVAFRPDGRVLATGGRDGTVRTFDPTTGAALATWRAHPC
jgi:WD40 repeat protein